MRIGPTINCWLFLNQDSTYFALRSIYQVNKTEAISRINMLAGRREPFFMLTDFNLGNNHVFTLPELDKEAVLFEFDGLKNFDQPTHSRKEIKLQKTPVDYQDYLLAYDHVHQEIVLGNTYLLNLTFPTGLESDLNLLDVFHHATARYRLWYKNQFVVFSPETFVKIDKGRIASFPMKGTIDADLPNAEQRILHDEKEMAEHATIVDLIRNDMSIHAHDVKVDKLRYIDEIRTNEKHLLQVSSKISGRLPDDYLNKLGDIIYSLLPAGSISGAPKKKTLEIIEAAEHYERGYYTGIMGYFDGESFDSGVMIRYIENQDGKFVYKSGGGIHFLSDSEAEYQEMIDKVYVPVH